MEELLGNHQLVQGLSAAIEADRLSHSYLISGPEGSGKHTLARYLAAAMQCTALRNRPCGRCLACRKVFDGVHPDVITVDDSEKKTVPVELIRRARSDLYIRPNEGRRKIYLIPRANDLNASAQNALLKVMEEPPAYGAFLLLSDNAERLLPTIRSRCVCLQMSPLEQGEALPALARRCPGKSREDLLQAWSRAGGFLGQALALLQTGCQASPQTQVFARCFAARDRLGLTELLVPLERKKRDELIPLLLEWVALLAEAMKVRAGLPEGSEAARQLSRSRTTRELLEAVSRLRQAAELLQGNVAPGAVCGALQVWLDSGSAGSSRPAG